MLKDNEERALVYQVNIDLENQNDSKVIIYNNVSANSKVLDVGCACGDLGLILSKNKDCEMYGLDYNQASVDIAKGTGCYKEVSQVDLNNFDTSSFSSYENKFDFIILGDVLEHLLDPERILSLFRKFLKEDGCFLVSLPNTSHASIKSHLLLNNFEYMEFGLLDKTHIKFYTHKTIPNLFSRAKLEIENTEIVAVDVEGLHSANPYPFLPMSVKKYIFNDLHSYVFQYVMKARSSDLSFEELESINNEKMKLDSKNVPDYLLNFKKNVFNKLSVKNYSYFVFITNVKLFINKYLLSNKKGERKYKELLDNIKKLKD